MNAEEWIRAFRSLPQGVPVAFQMTSPDSDEIYMSETFGSFELNTGDPPGTDDPMVVVKMEDEV